MFFLIGYFFILIQVKILIKYIQKKIITKYGYQFNLKKFIIKLVLFI